MCFESILEGLFGSRLIEDLRLFKDCQPEGVSDWSFDENCLFCCLRREKVKEHLLGLNNDSLGSVARPLSFIKDQFNSISNLEREAEEFLNAVLHRKDIPSFTDPDIPVVAREIMQRMIRQFAAEYTSKTSSAQGSGPQPNGTSDQSLLTSHTSTSSSSPSPTPAPSSASVSATASVLTSASASARAPTPALCLSPSLSPSLSLSPSPALAPATPALALSTASASAPAPAPGPAGLTSARNPVLSQLLMAEQEAPLDLTVKKQEVIVCEQDGVLDLSTKKTWSSRGPVPIRAPMTPLVKGASHSLGFAHPRNQQSTSDLDRVMAKLCGHHQRQIVDALGYLETEVKAVKAMASSSVSQVPPRAVVGPHERTHVSPVRTPRPETWDSKRTERAQPFSPKATCKTAGPHTAVEFAMPGSSKREVLDRSYYAGSRNVRGPGLIIDLRGDENEGGNILSSLLTSSHGYETVRHPFQSPQRVCSTKPEPPTPPKDKRASDRVLCASTASEEVRKVSETTMQTGSQDLDVIEVLPSSQPIKSPQPSSEGFPRHAKEIPSPPSISQRPCATISPNPPRTARKSRNSSLPRTKDGSLYRVDPDINCDIVYIGKSITECHLEPSNRMLPRRNARKSIRGHMYTEDYLELKTVRTLARKSTGNGTGNCPLPMPVITMVTPKQVLAKPDGVPPVDMPFPGGECGESVSQTPPPETPRDNEMLGDVLSSVSDADMIVETSQTGQTANQDKVDSNTEMTPVLTGQTTSQDNVESNTEMKPVVPSQTANQDMVDSNSEMTPVVPGQTTSQDEVDSNSEITPAGTGQTASKDVIDSNAEITPVMTCQTTNQDEVDSNSEITPAATGQTTGQDKVDFNSEIGQTTSQDKVDSNSEITPVAPGQTASLDKVIANNEITPVVTDESSLPEDDVIVCSEDHNKQPVLELPVSNENNDLPVSGEQSKVDDDQTVNVDEQSKVADYSEPVSEMTKEDLPPVSEMTKEDSPPESPTQPLPVLDVKGVEESVVRGESPAMTQVDKEEDPDMKESTSDVKSVDQNVDLDNVASVEQLAIETLPLERGNTDQPTPTDEEASDKRIEAESNTRCKPIETEIKAVNEEPSVEDTLSDIPPETLSEKETVTREVFSSPDGKKPKRIRKPRRFGSSDRQLRSRVSDAQQVPQTPEKSALVITEQAPLSIVEQPKSPEAKRPSRSVKAKASESDSSKADVPQGAEVSQTPEKNDQVTTPQLPESVAECQSPETKRPLKSVKAKASENDPSTSEIKESQEPRSSDVQELSQTPEESNQVMSAQNSKSTIDQSQSLDSKRPLRSAQLKAPESVAPNDNVMESATASKEESQEPSADKVKTESSPPEKTVADQAVQTRKLRSTPARKKLDQEGGQNMISASSSADAQPLTTEEQQDTEAVVEICKALSDTTATLTDLPACHSPIKDTVTDPVGHQSVSPAVASPRVSRHMPLRSRTSPVDSDTLPTIVKSSIETCEPLPEKSDPVMVEDNSPQPSQSPSTSSATENSRHMPLRGRSQGIDSDGSSSSANLSENLNRMPLRSSSSISAVQPTSPTPSARDKKVQSYPRPSKSGFLSSDTDSEPSLVGSPLKYRPARSSRVQKKDAVIHDALPGTSNTEPTVSRSSKFLEAMNREEGQLLIANLNTKFDKMQKGWVQMDKEGPQVSRSRNKADRFKHIWKSKRRIRKPRPLESQRFSPVQMLFMKSFHLPSICRWFLQSTETKSLVIVKHLNTRHPSETQLCFQSSSSMAGTSHGNFPSVQAERLKKHLKKFAIASPVKSTAKSQKLIADALEQDPINIEGKDNLLSTAATRMSTKPHSYMGVTQTTDTQKVTGAVKNPASARILRKYSHMREKMQGQHKSRNLKDQKAEHEKASRPKVSTAQKPALPKKNNGKEAIVAKKDNASQSPSSRRSTPRASIKESDKEKVSKSTSSKVVRELADKDTPSPKRAQKTPMSPRPQRTTAATTSSPKSNRPTNKKENLTEKLTNAKSPQTPSRRTTASTALSPKTNANKKDNAAEKHPNVKSPPTPTQRTTPSTALSPKANANKKENTTEKRPNEKSPQTPTSTSDSKAETKKPVAVKTTAVVVTSPPVPMSPDSSVAQDQVLTRSQRKMEEAHRMTTESPKSATKRAQDPVVNASPAKRTRTSLSKTN
ncbi:mucin-2 isoform X2 [Engraulis encrasicolus]|uniref:mucin-2 isoform X2 n=1 Tax=Engraulis encrasicolus TaxID=184585 RepID=UPI002FCF4445